MEVRWEGTSVFGDGLELFRLPAGSEIHDVRQVLIAELVDGNVYSMDLGTGHLHELGHYPFDDSEEAS